MGDKTRELLKAKRRHGWYLAVMLVLAVLVTVGVGGLFHQPAVAKTYQVTALTCTAEAPVGPGYAGYFVHTHNEDCFDENETLVCPLPEIKAHVHDETCYTTTSVQICGLAESDGHQHTEACYTRVRGDLICTLSTEPVLDEAGNVLEEGHVHTDECFAWTEELTCGMEAGEGAHHHSDSCFEYVTSLSCDMPEIILHTHTDDCYQKNEDGSIYVDEDGNTFLICGMTEVTEHVHGPECFTTYELDDEAAGNTENTEGDESGLIFLFPEEGEEEAQPAENQETDPEAAEGTDADGETDADAADSTDPSAAEENPEAAGDDTAVAEEPHEVVYTGTRGAEKGGVTVLAEIPDGALDESAQLVLSDADESALRKQILAVVNENAAEGEEREISSMLLMDIGFVSSGEPAVLNGLDPIRVTLKAAAIRTMSAPKLFHLSDGTAQEVKDVLFDAEAGTAVFTATSFSPFAIVDLTGEDPAAETAKETVSVLMPAQSFTGETDGVLVSVEAPEGAFPEGTTMVVSPVEMDDDTLSNVTGAVESSGEKKVVTAQAVDISFFDADGTLIEPKLPIRVSMKSALVSESENVALVHLTEAAAAEPAENAEAEAAEAPAAPTAEVVTDVQVVENPDEHNEIQFESDAFSVYVLVGTETITTNYITADGETYTITVTYGPEAGIPAGATLAVAEIPQDSEEYAAYLAQAQTAVKAGAAEAAAEPAEVTQDAVETPEEAEAAEEAPEGSDSSAEAENTSGTNGTADRVTVTTARFFDITILDAEGNPVEPAAPVDVKIEYMEPAESAENYQVVHFGEETEVLNPAVSGTDGTASAFDFQASSFSVFGVVGTKTLTTQVITAEGVTYTIEVTYGPEAGIPEGAMLDAKEIPVGSEEYQKYFNEAAEKFSNETGLSYARFFDIRIVSDEQEVEPKASVETKITYADEVNLSENTLAAAVHFTETGMEVISVKTDDKENPTEFIFTQDSFSVTGTVVTGLVDGQYMIYARTAASTYYTLTHYRYNNYYIGSESGSGSYGSYTGTTDSNILWDVTAASGGYQISAVYNGTRRYLRNNNGSLQWSATSSVWTYTNNHLQSGNYYLRWSNNSFSLTDNVNNASNIYFAWTNNEKNRNITIHFGEISNGSFVEWSSQTVSNPTYLGQQVNLTGLGEAAMAAAGKTGYRYVTTKVTDPSSGTEIYTKLQTIDARPEANNSINSSNYWLYRELDSVYYNYVDAGWNVWRSFADEEGNIYVIYEPAPSSSQTGSSPYGDLGAPATDKSVEYNNDGTYDVLLSVTGESKASKEKTRANVVIVYDVSWSMDNIVKGDGRTRKAIAESAIKSLANQLLNLNTSTDQDTVELAFVSFAAKVTNEQEANRIYSYGDYSDFESVINNLTYTSGTNWDAGLEAASHIQWKDADPLYVVFVSDGDTISRSTMIDQNNAVVWDGGTYRNPYNNEQLYQSYYTVTHDLNVAAAKQWADSLKTNGAKIYAVGAFGDEMQNLSQLSSSGTYINASSEDELLGEFENIINEIRNALGYEDVTINDGITAMTSTALVEGDVSSLRYYRSGGSYSTTANSGRGDEWENAPPAFILEVKSIGGTTKYYKNGDEVSLSDLTDMSETKYLEKYPIGTKTVIWDIDLGSDDDGNTLLLEDGVTYTVAFTVWPSQEAYDLIADLNNGVKEYEKLSPGEKDQIYEDGGKYYLKTNTNATVDYTSVQLENGQPIGTPTTGSATIPDPNGKMVLDTKMMTVKKLFTHNLGTGDEYTRIRFYLKVDGQYYNKDGSLTAELNEETVYKIDLPKDDGKWEDTVYIAPGLMKDGQILETGHKYTVEEVILSGNIYEYEFTPQTVRPMAISSTAATYLVLKDKYNTGSGTEYVFDDENETYRSATASDATDVYYEDAGNDGTLTGTNRKTAELDITKVISGVSTDSAGQILTTDPRYKETFTYRVKLSIPADSDPCGILGREYVPRLNDSVNGATRVNIYGYQGEQNETATTFEPDTTRFRGRTYGAWNSQIYKYFVQTYTSGSQTLVTRDADGNFIWREGGDGVTAAKKETIGGKEYYTIELDATIKMDEVYRFNNLPTGTLYTITEYYWNKYNADNSSQSEIRTIVSDASNIAASGYDVSVNYVTAPGQTSSVHGNTVSGVIDDLDIRYYNKFVNTLKNDPDIIQIQVTKHLEGYEWTGERYYFRLEPVGDAPMPVTLNQQAYIKKDSGAEDGNYAFGYIRFTSAGTYQYKITELDPATAGISAYSAVADVTGYGVEKTITIVVDDSLKVTSVNGTDTTYSDNTVNTTFTNTKTTGILIQLLKLGDGSFDHLLNGVTFELYEDQACTKQITEDGFGTPIGTNGVITTNSNGMAEIGMLKAGTYYLKETGTVDGYNLLTETIKIVVGSDLTVTYTQSSFNNSNKGPDLVYTDAEGDQDQYFYYSKIRGDETDTYARNDEYKFVGYRIVVSNQSGVELPATGGPGTQFFTAIGSVLILTSIAALSLKLTRRRKQQA